MSADFAGALAAIVDKFKAEWVIGAVPRTRVAEVNKPPADPWPPKDGAGKLLPYALIAPQGGGGDLIGFGSPGNRVYLYSGLIHAHCYEPVGDGSGTAFPLAVAAGEIFRTRQFYDTVSPGCYIKSYTPRIDGGGPGDDDGIWFRVTATIPFEYYHLG
jgi:hypothetical protein